MDNLVVKRTYAFSLPAYFSRESTLSAVHAFPAGAALWSNRNTSAHMGTGTLVRAAPHKLPFPEHLGSGILCRNAGRAPALNTIERSSYHTEQVACLSPCASPHLAKPIQASFQGACFDLSIRSESLAAANSQPGARPMLVAAHGDRHACAGCAAQVARPHVLCIHVLRSKGISPEQSRSLSPIFPI